MDASDGFQIVLCVITGNLLTLLIFALAMPVKKKRKDMLCNECNEKKATVIKIGATERYFCDECHERWANTKKDQRGRERIGTSGPSGRKSDM